MIGTLERGAVDARGVVWSRLGWTLATLIAGLACHAAPAPSGPHPIPAKVASASTPTAPDGRSVSARIALDAGEGDSAGIGVELELRGPSAELAQLRLGSVTHGALADLELRDQGGTVPFEPSARGEALDLRTTRAVRGALHASYRVKSIVAGFDDALASTLGPDRFRLSGETALLLPTAFEQQALSVELAFDLAGLPPGSRVASTLGRELSHLECTGAELRHASFLGGKLNSARFVTEQAIDEWIWLEVLGFDARPVSGEAAALRSELARYFESRAPSPFVVLASASVRLDGSFTAAARSGGLLLELPVDTSWAGPARIAVCRELFRPWLGGEVRLVGNDGGPSPSELWFNEGVARTLARELLFRFGMLTPDEYTDEVNGIIGSVVLSPYVGRPAAELAEHARTDRLARRHLAARGVLYATALAARIRAASAGSRALDPILSELFTRARAEQRPLTLRDWLAAASKQAGGAAASDYRRIIEAGQLPAFAAQGLGPCFRLATRRYLEFELGLDVESSRGRAHAVVGLVAGGPAARAGLRATDRLTRAHYRDGDPSVEAMLEVDRDGRRITLQYPPVGRRIEGPAWLRRSDVPDAACQGR